MNTLDVNLQKIARSDEVYEGVTAIGNKFNLMLDSNNELVAETKDVIVGFKSSRDFIKNIQERLEIDEDTAKSIATEVNQKVLEPIKEKLRILESEQSTREAVVGNEMIRPSAPITEKETTKPENTAINKELGESKPVRVDGVETVIQPKKDYRVVNSTSSYGDINEIKIQKPATPIVTSTATPTPVQAPKLSQTPKQDIVYSPIQIKKSEPTPTPTITPAPTAVNTERVDNTDIHSKMMSDIERAGDFVIEKDTLLSDTTSNESTKTIDRDKLLNGIENPDKIDPIRVTDHLLGNMNHSKENRVEIKKDVTNKTKSEEVVNKNMYTVDPYREAL